MVCGDLNSLYSFVVEFLLNLRSAAGIHIRSLQQIGSSKEGCPIATMASEDTRQLPASETGQVSKLFQNPKSNPRLPWLPKQDTSVVKTLLRGCAACRF